MSAVTTPKHDAAAVAALMRAIVCVARGGSVSTLPRKRVADARHDAARVCIATLLRDTRRFSVLGARDGAPLSIASVHAAAALRFIGGSFRGVLARVVRLAAPRPCMPAEWGGEIWSHNGAALNATTVVLRGMHATNECMSLRVYDIETGALLHRIGGGVRSWSSAAQFCATIHRCCTVWLKMCGRAHSCAPRVAALRSLRLSA